MPPRLSSLWLLLATSVVAQAPTPPTTAATPPDLGAPAALPDGAPAWLAGIDRQRLREHAAWLADDAREGRYTSSKGQQATAKYVADHFQKLGLRPLGDKKGFLQAYPLRRVGIDPTTTLTYGAQKLAGGFAVLAADDTGKVALSGRLVWCGNGTAEQVPGSLEAKLPVVLLHNLPKGGGVGGDLRAIQRFLDVADKLRGKGASAGIVCLLDDQGSYGNCLNYHGLLPDHPKLQFGNGGGGGVKPAVPLLVLSAAQSRPLLQHLGVPFDDTGAPKTGPTNDKATAKLHLLVKVDDKATASNVVAVLDGKNRKAEAIVLSAHHDHIGKRLDGDSFNGADDNASGTSGLLTIAEAFAKAPERPDRSIVFLSVSGEELGLWGSQWFSEHPTWPLERIVANVNIDMIGRAGGEGASIAMQITPSFGHDKYSTLVQEAVAIGGRFGIRFTSGDQYYERSDHYNFAKQGIPVVFFCDGEHPDYHQVSDHADRLDYARMEAVARTAAWTTLQAANQSGKPKDLGKRTDW